MFTTRRKARRKPLKELKFNICDIISNQKEYKKAVKYLDKQPIGRQFISVEHIILYACYVKPSKDIIRRYVLGNVSNPENNESRRLFIELLERIIDKVKGLEKVSIGIPFDDDFPEIEVSLSEVEEKGLQKIYEQKIEELNRDFNS